MSPTWGGTQGGSTNAGVIIIPISTILLASEADGFFGVFFVRFSLSNHSNEKTMGKGAREKRPVGFLGLPMFNFPTALSLSLRTTN